MRATIFIAIIYFSFGMLYSQGRRFSSISTDASLMESRIVENIVDYSPQIVKLGKIVDINDNVAYVHITKILSFTKGDLIYYSVNIQSQPNSLLAFSGISHKNIHAMDILDGLPQKGDYVYLKFIPHVVAP